MKRIKIRKLREYAPLERQKCGLVFSWGGHQINRVIMFYKNKWFSIEDVHVFMNHSSSGAFSQLMQEWKSGDDISKNISTPASQSYICYSIQIKLEASSKGKKWNSKKNSEARENLSSNPPFFPLPINSEIWNEFEIFFFKFVNQNKSY